MMIQHLTHLKLYLAWRAKHMYFLYICTSERKHLFFFFSKTCSTSFSESFTNIKKTTLNLNHIEPLNYLLFNLKQISSTQYQIV